MNEQAWALNERLSTSERESECLLTASNTIVVSTYYVGAGGLIRIA